MTLTRKRKALGVGASFAKRVAAPPEKTANLFWVSSLSTENASVFGLDTIVRASFLGSLGRQVRTQLGS